MEALSAFFTVHSVPQTILVLSLVIATGLALGSVRVLGIQVGIAGVLFSGLAFAHAGLSIDHGTLEMLRDLGLIFFVYSIGMQLGRSFGSAFRRDGLRLNLVAAAIVVAGSLLAVFFTRWGGLDRAVAAGIFAGATTNTPSLAAAGEALRCIGDPESAKLAGVGYAVAYPFGILGIIFTMLIIKGLFRLDPAAEAARHETENRPTTAPVEVMNLEVKNPNLDDLPVGRLPFIDGSSVVVSRIYHDGVVSVAQPDTVVKAGDILLAVGPKNELSEFALLVGVPSVLDLRELDSQIAIRRVVVTRKKMLGKSIRELAFTERYGVRLTRVIRADIQFSAAPSLRIEYGDVLIAVGPEEALMKAARELGNAPAELNHPQLIPVFVGIFLGVLLGMFPLQLPGLPAPIKLGLAGGPLVVALALGRIGRWGELVWYLPTSANFMLREIGITLFLACVGLISGESFVRSVVDGSGLHWMLLGAVITAVPLLAAAFFCRLYWRMNLLTLSGLLAGSMTDPPALSFANSLARSNAAGVSYAAVYPLVMLLRILAAQLLVLFL